ASGSRAQVMELGSGAPGGISVRPAGFGPAHSRSAGVDGGSRRHSQRAAAEARRDCGRAVAAVDFGICVPVSGRAGSKPGARARRRSAARRARDVAGCRGCRIAADRGTGRVECPRRGARDNDERRRECGRETDRGSDRIGRAGTRSGGHSRSVGATRAGARGYARGAAGGGTRAAGGLSSDSVISSARCVWGRRASEGRPGHHAAWRVAVWRFVGGRKPAVTLRTRLLLIFVVVVVGTVALVEGLVARTTRDAFERVENQ